MLIVRLVLTLNRSPYMNPSRSVAPNPMYFFGLVANLHPGTLLYCSTLLHCSTVLYKVLYLHPDFVI